MSDNEAIAREWARRWGKVGADRRARESVACAVCGVVTIGISTRRYCSNRCRQRAKNARAAAGPKPRPETTP